MPVGQQPDPEPSNKHAAALLQQASKIDADVHSRFEAIRNGNATLRFDEANGTMSKGHAVRSAQAAVVNQLQATREKLSPEDAKFLQSYVDKYQKGGTPYADGAYGADTKKLVAIFQKANGLKQDGVIAKETLAAIEKSAGQLSYRAELEREPLPLEVINQLKAGKPAAAVPAPAKPQVTAPSPVTAPAPATVKEQAPQVEKAPAKATHNPYQAEIDKVPSAMGKPSTTPSPTSPEKPAEPKAEPQAGAAKNTQAAPESNAATQKPAEPAASNPPAAAPDKTAEPAVDAKAASSEAEAVYKTNFKDLGTLNKDEQVYVQLAKEVWEAARPGFTGWSTDHEKLFAALDGLETKEIPELEAVFKQHYNQDLKDVVRGELSGDLLKEANYHLDGKHAEAAAMKLSRVSEQWFGEDNAILATLKDKSADQLAIIDKTLELHNKPSVRSIIDENLSGIDLERGNALLTGNLNEFGHNAENDRLTVTALLNDEQYDEAFAILATRDPKEIAALVELDTSGDNRLLKTVAELGDSSIYKDRLTGLLSNDPNLAAIGEAHIALENGNVEQLLKVLERHGITKDENGKKVHSAANISALTSSYKEHYGKDFPEAAAALINDGRGWGADYGERILQDTTLIPAYRLEAAMDGVGTDEVAVREVLRRNDFTKLSADFNTLFGTTLSSDLAWDLGGRDQAYAERVQRPRAETLEQLIGYLRDDHAAERGPSSIIYEIADFVTWGAGKGELLDESLKRLENSIANASDGEITATERKELLSHIEFVNQDLSGYRDAKESAGNAVGTVAGTAAATAVVVGTGGLAAPLVAAGAAGAGAGGYIIGKASTQGLNYDVQGIIGDGAIGAVDGAFTAVGGKAITAGGAALLNVAKAPIATTTAALTATTAAVQSVSIPGSAVIANGARAIATAAAPVTEPLAWLTSEAALRTKIGLGGIAQNVINSAPVQSTIHTSAAVAGHSISLANNTVQAGVRVARGTTERGLNLLRSATPSVANTPTTSSAAQSINLAAKPTFSEEVKQITHEILGDAGIHALTTKEGAKALGKTVVEESKQIANEVLGHKVTGAAKIVAEKASAATIATAEKVSAVGSRIAENQTLRNSGQFLINNFGDGALGGGTSEAVRALAEGDNLQSIIERSMFGATAGAIGAGVMRGAINGTSSIASRIPLRANAAPLPTGTLSDEVSNALASAKALGANIANPPFAAVDDANFFVSNGLEHRIDGIHKKVTEALQNGDIKAAAAEIRAVRNSTLRDELGAYLDELDEALEIAAEELTPFVQTTTPNVPDTTPLDIPTPIISGQNTVEPIGKIFEPLKEVINDQLAGSTSLPAYQNLLNNITEFAKAGDLTSARQAINDFPDFGIGSGGMQIKFDLESALDSLDNTTWHKVTPTNIEVTSTPEVTQTVTVTSSTQHPTSALAFDPLENSPFIEVTADGVPEITAAKPAATLVAPEPKVANNIEPVSVTTNPEALQARFASAVIPPPPAAIEVAQTASDLLEQAKAMEIDVSNSGHIASRRYYRNTLGYKEIEGLSGLVSVNGRWERSEIQKLMTQLHEQVSTAIGNGNLKEAIKEIEKSSFVMRNRVTQLYPDSEAAAQSVYMKDVKSYLDTLRRAVDAARQNS